MKITYLINGMFNSAGRERVVANKACFLTERGHQVTIITTDQKSRPYYYDVPTETVKIDFGVNYDDYSGLPIHKKVLYFIKKDNIFRNELRSFLKINPQDVIVTIEERFIPTIVSVAPKKTIIVAESHFNKFAFAEIGKSVNRSLIQRIVYSIRTNYVQFRYYNKLDAYVLLTHEDYDYWKGRKRNMYVIPNSISYNKNKQAKLDNCIVIAVGRLSYQKGFERLIDAWRLVAARCPGWELNIYGNGEDKIKLLTQIEQLGLSLSIKIYPPTSEIENRLLDASIYVLSSRFEGLPMVLLEAMSIGLPIISYDCKTGPKDIIQNGYNGYLVKEGEIELLANSIIELIQNEKLRKTVGNNAKLEASKYDHDVIALEWEKLFLNLKAQKA